MSEPSHNDNNNPSFPTMYKNRGIPTGESLAVVFLRRGNQHKIYHYQIFLVTRLFAFCVGD